MTPRDLALRILNSLDRRPDFSDHLLERHLRETPQWSDRDKALAVHLVQGVLRWRLRLDWIIQQAVSFRSKRIEPVVLNILRLAVYQIALMDRVPDAAAVNEAVKQTKKVARPHVIRFVNGLLRTLCRTMDRIPLPDRERDLLHYLSVRYSYPEWIIRRWERQLGSEAAERLLDAGNRIPPLIVRANTLRISRSDLAEALAGEGVQAVPTRHSPEGLELQGYRGPVTRLEAFRKGLFQVQGEAAQVCSLLLAPAPGDSVLDLCCGLGGKATHLAALTGDRASIIALDRAGGRLVSLAETCRRLGIRSVSAVKADAGRSLPFRPGTAFDRIMVDAPCSGLGILSRHPDGKWNKQESDIPRLAEIQRRILEGAASCLGGQGRLLYVNCTISPEESEELVDRFLEDHPEMARIDLSSHVPRWGEALVDGRGFFRTYPHTHGMEGFFGALFVKEAPSKPFRRQTHG